MRKQVAHLCASYYNVHKPKGAQKLEVEDFLVQLVTDVGQRQFEKMVATLSSVARTRPAGYKRKRPKQRRP